VRVAGVASDGLSLDVEIAPFDDCRQVPTSPPKCEQIHLVVKDTVVKDRVKQLHAGDRITVVYSTEKKDAEKNDRGKSEKNDEQKKGAEKKDDAKKDAEKADTDKTGRENGEKNGENVLKVFCTDVASGGPEARTRIWVLLVSALLCLLLYSLFTGFQPQRLMIGRDNRYSNSKFQITVWFFVLIATYVATLWLRVWYAGCEFIGGVNIPQNLLLISGMSVLTFGGAKAITTSKVNAAIAAGNTDPKNQANAQPPNFLLDLTHDDGKAAVNAQPPVNAQPAVVAQPVVPPQLDFGDFQMLIVTLIAVATYLVLVFHFLGTIETSKVVSLPDVDTTILAAFGLGHGAYLTKKAVGDVGQT
jgi:hypothetical protein